MKSNMDAKKWLGVCLLALSLIGCGSSDADETFDASDSWYNQELDIYLTITSDNARFYDYSAPYTCYSYQDASVTAMTSHSFTLGDYYSNASEEIDYQISDTGELVLGDLIFQAVDTNELPQGETSCERPEVSGDLEISITLSDIPTQFETPEGSNFGILLYRLMFEFDLNNNSQLDGGDLRFYISRRSHSDSESSSSSIESLRTIIDLQVSENRSNEITGFNYSISGTTITFTLPRSRHVAIASITPTTPLTISTHMRHNAEMEFEKDISTDRFPSTGYTQGTDNSEIVDELGDVTGYGSPMVDIVSASVRVTD